MRLKEILIIILLVLLILILGCETYSEPVCGNNIPEEGETIENCCIDIGCLGEQICQNNQCIEPTCGECQYLEHHVCKDYECCQDTDCRSDQICQDHKCQRKEIEKIKEETPVEKIPTNPCEDITCEDTCSNRNVYTQKCDNGQCVLDQLTERCNIECAKGECVNKCQTIEKNGNPNDKINLFFYEDGYNNDIITYHDRVERYFSILFGGQLDGSNFDGTDPFNQFESEFNIYSYSDSQNQYDGQYLEVAQNQPSTVKTSISEECSDFDNNNYNIVIVLGQNTQLYASGSASQDFSQSSQGIVKLGDEETKFIYMPPYGDQGKVIAHEIAHYIGFLDDEYDSMNLYLGGKSFAPNLDSASCLKWCQGVDTSSSCYQKYIDWLSCFKNDFILQIPEMQNVLTEHGLDYNTGYDWWGVCFDEEHWFMCGSSGILAELHKKILQGSEKDMWIQKWTACRNKAQLDCNMGLNCADNQGCYVRDGFATFTPTVGSIMEDAYNINNVFNPVCKDALINNIQNKDKTIEINVVPFTI